MKKGIIKKTGHSTYKRTFFGIPGKSRKMREKIFEFNFWKIKIIIYKTYYRSKYLFDPIGELSDPKIVITSATLSFYKNSKKESI